MTDRFSTVEEAVDQIGRGGVVIVVDAEDRENEGDYIAAAEKLTPETVNFILSGRGQFCMPVLPDVTRRLDLHPLVEHNTSKLTTPFVTPLDHASARTGITAGERCHTVRRIIDPASTPEEFVRPGHVHVLLAKEGGVLRRAGHTEATVDLARMAGLAPAGVLCEILDETGNRASRETLFDLATLHDLPIVSIDQLVAHRRVSEKLVARAAESRLPTVYGDFRIIVYDVKYESQNPIALVMGDVAHADAPLVRMHSSCFTGDLLDSLRCDCGDQLRTALDRIGEAGTGVLVYLPQEGRGIGLVDKIRAYGLQDDGLDTVEANHALGHAADKRDYGIGLQILKDLGLREIRLLTNNPKKLEAFQILRSFNLVVTEQIPITIRPNPHNEAYLSAKREKLGHFLPTETP